MKEEHMKYYNLMRAVPQEAQKGFSNGSFSGTDIKPQWRIEKLTELFGMCGFGWYTEVVSRHMQEAIDGTVCTFVSINLYVKVDGEWSKPIYGEGGNTFVKNVKAKGDKPAYLSVTDEAYKMAYTDAISNAAKMIGLGADIWFENSPTKYDLQMQRANELFEHEVECASSIMDLNTLVVKYSIGTKEQKMKIMERGNKLGFTFNKGTKQFEQSQKQEQQ
jgi:hypothetical protein